MSRAEFLDTLRNQLSGQMQEGKTAAHVQYYQNYIQTQIDSGRSEEEVLGELGDPRLIAKTLLDTDDGQETAQEYQGAYTENGSYTDETGQDVQRSRRYKLDLSTWYGKLIVIAIAAVVIVALVAIIGTILPFVIAISLIIFLLSKFRKK